MTCMDCGRARLAVSRETVKYDASGLRGVTLRNVEVRKCPECGYREIVLPHIEELHRVLADLVIRKEAPLAAEEIRFLRKYLGWSGEDFARHIGAAPETVSRWENGRLAMSAMADRLLRTMVAVNDPTRDYSLEYLLSIRPSRTTKPLRVGLERGAAGWKKSA